MTGEKAPKAVVIGASSGIGRSLVKELASRGYDVGFTARRTELLESLQKEIPSRTFFKAMDIARPEEAFRILESLIKDLGGMDLIVINAGINRPNPELEWELERETIDINVRGFAALADFAARYFLGRGKGHLAAVSSIAGQYGSPRVPAYCASKAFMSIYLQGLFLRLSSKGIAVTDIRPGFVDTPMIAGRKSKFWVASSDLAAMQIADALKARRAVVYVTRRWALVAFLLTFVPVRILGMLYARFKN